VIGTKGPLIQSCDSGISWQVVSSNFSFWDVCISADSKVAVATALDSQYVLVRTLGSTFFVPKGSAVSGVTWRRVAMTYDGRTIITGAYSGGPAVISRDYGMTWANLGLPLKYWLAAFISLNGTMMVFASHNDDNGVHVSIDSGMTWKTGSNAGSAFWVMEGLPDGSRLVAGGSSLTNKFYYSTTSGASWTAYPAGSHIWYDVDISADGRVLAGSGDRVLYISTNFGAAWSSRVCNTVGAVTVTSDGSAVWATCVGAGPLRFGTS
jgi:hypothetical protein